MTSPDAFRRARSEVLVSVDLPVLLAELGAFRGLHPRARRFPCPRATHDQTGRTPPVTTRAATGGYDLWCCHACGAGGTAIDALLEAGLARDVPQALEQLGGGRSWDRARDWEASTPRGGRRRDPARPASTPSATELAQARRGLARYAAECHERLRTPQAAAARSWLHARGLTDAEIAAHRIGYDPGYRELQRPFRTLPAPVDAAITLPVFSATGTLVYAQARRLEPGTGSKFLNPYADWIGPSPRLGVVHSPAGVDRSVLLVTEGLCDGILAGRHFEARALIGARQPDEKVAEDLVAAAAGRPVLICLDADATGRAGTERLVAMLAERARGGVATIELPVNDITALWKRDHEGFESTLRPLVDDAARDAVTDRSNAPRRPRRERPAVSELGDNVGESLLQMLGKRRRELIENRVASLSGWLAADGDASLAARRDELLAQLPDLDATRATNTLRLERELETVAARLEMMKPGDRAELARLTHALESNPLDAFIEANFDRIVELTHVERTIRAEIEPKLQHTRTSQRARQPVRKQPERAASGLEM